MRFLKRLSTPKEVRIALQMLDVAQPTLTRHEAGNLNVVLPAASELVRARVTRMLLGNTNNVVEMIRKGTSIPELVFTGIFDAAATLASTGEHHIYRGMLTPKGVALLVIAHRAMEELQRIGAATESEVEKVKARIRTEIDGVG